MFHEGGMQGRMISVRTQRLPVQNSMGGGFLGQASSPPISPVREPVSQTPPNATQLPPTSRAVQVEPGKPGRRWGRLKKLEAQELFELLKTVLETMKAKGIPPGIVQQVKDKLGQFVATAAPDQEFVLSDEEILALDVALEQVPPPGPAVPPLVWAGVAGAVVIGIIALS